MAINGRGPDKFPSLEDFDVGNRVYLKGVGLYACKIGNKWCYEIGDGSTPHPITLPLGNGKKEDKSGGLNLGKLEKGIDAWKRAYNNMWL